MKSLNCFFLLISHLFITYGTIEQFLCTFHYFLYKSLLLSYYFFFIFIAIYNKHMAITRWLLFISNALLNSNCLKSNYRKKILPIFSTLIYFITEFNSLKKKIIFTNPSDRHSHKFSGQLQIIAIFVRIAIIND